MSSSNLPTPPMPMTTGPRSRAGSTNSASSSEELLSRSPTSTVFRSLIEKAVQKHVDPWAKHKIHEIPAERVYRHRYLPSTGTWTVDESIVKIETVPFDHGAMRSTYRMKKISQSHLRKYQKLNWNKAPNYVAKAYKNDENKWNPEDRDKVFDDIKLQYEADRWATKYNTHNPRKKIHFIQCFAIEFFQRPGCPVLGCERFVDGTDEFGAGFVKHNSNAGFVDHHESRMTPQTFSAYSFYASQGKVMVVDIQGVNDLYTDPQVHSVLTKFGDADLGYRGMAYFFASFVRNPLCEFFLLPRFKLSAKLSAKSREECLKLYQRFPSVAPPAFATNINTISDAEEIVQAIGEAFEFAVKEVELFELSDKADYVKPLVCVIEDRAQLTFNTAEVHLTSSIMHTQGLLPKSTEPQDPDYSSAIFHCCQACILGNWYSALTIGRLLYGLNSCFSECLAELVTTDINRAIVFLKLASYRGSVAASWLVGQWYIQQRDEANSLKFLMRYYCLLKRELAKVKSDTKDAAAILVAEDPNEEENNHKVYVESVSISMNNPSCYVIYTPADAVRHSIDHSRSDSPSGHCNKIRYHVGDEVLASTSSDLSNCKYHLAKIVSIHTNHSVIVSYNDDHSEEELSLDRLKPISHAMDCMHLSPLLQEVHQRRNTDCEQDFEKEVNNVLVKLGASSNSSSSTSYLSEPLASDTMQSQRSYQSYNSGVSANTIVSCPEGTVIGAATPSASSPSYSDEFVARPASYEFEAAFAELLVNRGEKSDQLLAYDLYNSASATCAALGKGKLAAKYAELAESF